MINLNAAIEMKLKETIEKRNDIIALCENMGEPLDTKGEKVNSRFSLNVESLKDLRVACIMDQFTLDSYGPECNLIELVPDKWQEQIEEFKPHLIFVESAWDGKDGLWHDKIVKASDEYFAMVSFCNEKTIPVLFWNKEDPVWTDKFMLAASAADVVFTTDVDCVAKYKQELGHDNVYQLHFAAQPKYHNPIEKYNRKDKFCFAGAYYHRYAERCKVFDQFAKVFIDTKGFDIFDRNYKKARPEHAFPKFYNKYIIGNLKSDEIDVAYKGYNYGINMNSVNQSQSMFARRVFEMLASNTVTVGNYARGVKNLFGDLTICTDNEQVLEEELKKYCADEWTMNKYRLLGLRKVLSQHLYEDRLGFIVEKVFGKKIETAMPVVNVISYACNQEEYDYIVRSYERQSYEKKNLIIFVDDSSIRLNDNYRNYKKEKLEQQITSFVNGNEFVAVFGTKNYYGEHYLTDMALSQRYIVSDVVGKNAYCEWKEDAFLYNEGVQYKQCDTLKICCSMWTANCFVNDTVQEILEKESIVNRNMFSIHPFHYCANYTGENCDFVDDIEILDQGVTVEEIDKIVEKIDGFGYDETNINGYVSRGNVLILSNYYPDYSNLYRNMFVHKRAKVYKQNGLNCDVMVMNLYTNSVKYREFEGINIIEGNGTTLTQILEAGQIDTVCVHFLDSMMWEVLKPYLDKIKLIVWSHGSDIQPWWRREYLYETESDKKAGEEQTAEKMKLWKDVFAKSEQNNIHFVFVSQYFADIVMEDYEYIFKENEYSIIHNCIDTEMFSYEEKGGEQRKKIISIRPYSSSVYANDITVKVIKELSKRPFFKQLEFLIAGDGMLFDEITKPLKKYKNVTIMKGFLRQQDIAKLYHDYGIVLIPSRADTQGVSRDEAMSCGLVPVTNAVQAIPEFVDESCGYLAENEDYMQMANALEELFYNEDKYVEMSKNAAEHVRELSSVGQTIEKEMFLINRD